MAKPPPSPSGRSKVKVLFIDADLAPGDLQELTQSITAAIRPTHIISRVAPSARLAAAANGKPQDDQKGELEEIEGQELEQTEDVEQESEAPTPRAASKPRKYRVPKVLPQVELDAPKSWPDFVAEKKPSDSLPERYLTVAAWFKWHRNTDAIGIDHVYTCFLHPKVKWSTVIEDFDATFRYHKKRNRVSKADKGLYAINQIGLGEVEEFATKTAG